MMWTLEVSRTDLSDCTVWREAFRALEPDEVLVEIENLALTANTMTYAALGEEMGYWSLFPASADSRGRIPAWGHGRVLSSTIEGISADERLFGLWPMASHVLLRGRRSRLGLLVTSASRSALNPVYNQYALEPLADGLAREMRAVFHPLFVTSFVLAEHLLEIGGSGARQVVLVSASSKTALGTAHQLKGMRGLIGLTSPRHAAWLQEAGVYDSVCHYDQLERLADAGPSVIVDFSGNASLRARVSDTLGASFAGLLKVGWTHVGTLGADSTGADPGGEVFFGPARIEELAARWGPAEFDRRLNESLRVFTRAMQGRFAIEHRDGLEGTEAAYHDVREGEIDPSRLLVARPCEVSGQRA